MSDKPICPICRQEIDLPDNQLAKTIASEPWIKVFEAEGLICIIIRNVLMNYCGYVVIPNNHPLYGKPQEEIEDLLEVHGGITHVGSLSWAPNLFLIGFDCGHAHDIVPAMMKYSPAYIETHQGAVYRDINYVEQEVRKLAKQINDVRRYQMR